LKIFRKYYVRYLYTLNKLDDIIELLIPWIDEVLYKDSPFLLEVASYRLRKYGCSYAPKIFKTVIANEILRLNELEDLRSMVLLAIVISYRRYNPAKGKVDLTNWLSWTIPYELSKLVTWKITHPIEPAEVEYIHPEMEEFEKNIEIENQISILCKELNIPSWKTIDYLVKSKEKKNATLS
jgi:hypothetical protein